MECPFCSVEMNEGYITGKNKLMWVERAETFADMILQKNVVEISKMPFGNAIYYGMFCPECGRIILQLNNVVS